MTDGSELTAVQIVGTCKIEVTVREGSPLLKQILSHVGIEGLPNHVCSEPRGLLRELIDARQEEIVSAEKDRLNDLADDQLVADVLVESSECVGLALEILAERIKGGSVSACVALVDALIRLQEEDIPQDSYLEDRYSSLRYVFDMCVAAARPSVDHLTERELENIINAGREDNVSCAARQRLEEIHLQTSHLAALPTMPLHEVIDKYNQGIFVEQKVRKRARQRLERETMTKQEVADVLPFGSDLVEGFLKGLGVARIGCLHSPRSIRQGNLWNREEVMQTIQNTTARLLFRAKNEFHGPLPDHLHAAMMLAPADDYQRAYSHWLKQNGW